jgi:hypothetical protein
MFLADIILVVPSGTSTGRTSTSHRFEKKRDLKNTSLQKVTADNRVNFFRDTLEVGFEVGTPGAAVIVNRLSQALPIVERRELIVPVFPETQICELTENIE